MGKKKTNPVECGKCKASITKTQYSLKCAGDCGKSYHKKCSGLSDAQFLAYEKRIANDKWICSSCAKSKLLVESGESDSSDDESAENPSNGKILKVLNSRFAELEKAITFNGDMMEALQETIKAITEENKTLKKQQDQLKTRVTDLEKEVNIIKKKMLKEENEGRKKNIIIMGLKGDKDAEINVKKIFTKMEQDADDYTLSVLPTSSSQKAVIVVQFQKEEQRNAILDKGKKLKLDGQNCNISDSTSRIYINEDLSREVRDAFKYARELKKEGFKYVWCKNGQVYVRKEEGGAVVRVYSHADVNVLKAR
nr:unnamed protein product [Callosobruchus chinensis]